MENLKPKTLDTIPTLEEAKKSVELIKKLKEKESLLGTYLQNIESKILNDQTLRKDEKEQLEQIFNQIEGFKKMVTEKMNDPVVQIDEQLQDLEQQLESKSLRKDEKVTLEQEFNTLETKKKLLDNKPEVQPEIIVPEMLEPADQGDETTPLPMSSGATQAAPEPAVEEPTEPEPAPEPTPAPAKSPAQLLAEKIRSGQELSAEDYEYRTKHWADVSEALLNYAQPEPIIAENVLEYTPPGLEWVRSEYANLLFKNKDALKYGFDIVDNVAIREHVKQVSENYHQLRFAEIQKIHDDGGTIHDQLEFQKKETDALVKEIMRLENEETKKRINKAIDNILNRAESGYDATKNKIVSFKEKLKRKTNPSQGKPREQLGLLMKLLYIPASPTIGGAWAGNKAYDKFSDGISALKKKFSESFNQKEAKKKALAEKYGEKNKEGKDKKKDQEKKDKKTLKNKKPEDLTDEEKVALEQEKQNIEKRKNDFLEKAFDGKVEGENEKQWEKTKKIPVAEFFRLAPQQESEGKLKPWQKILYEKLKGNFKKNKGTLEQKITLDDYITNLAEQDKLKDVWNQPSPSNS